MGDRTSLVPSFNGNFSKVCRSVESMPAIFLPHSSILSHNYKQRYSQSIDHNYLNDLLQKVKKRYSHTFYELLVSFLHFDPDVRIKADRLYRDYLTPVEK